MILGTAQLGMEYGINNHAGQPDMAHGIIMLKHAYDCGVRRIDTAPAYGNSESVIGEYQKTHTGKFEICSKLPVNIDLADEGSADYQVSSFIQESLRQMHANHLYCCYLHRFEQCRKAALISALKNAKNNGLIANVGISVYNPEELEYISSDLSKKVDIVQIPLNVFSLARWEKPIINAHKNGIVIFARSIFLQGLVFMKHDDEFSRKINATRFLQHIQSCSKERGTTIAQLCYDAVASMQHVEEIIMGCETLDQLTTNLLLEKNYRKLTKMEFDAINSEMNSISQVIINPSLWPQR